MGKQEGPRSGKLRMSSSQDPEDSRALCTGTVPADRSLDTGVAGSQPDACDRAECAGAPGDRPARGTKSATDRLDARVVEPSTGPRPPALQARGPRLDAAMALARLAGAAAGPRRTGPGARGARRRDACGAGQRAVWGLGSLHPGRGVAWAGAARGLGGVALPVAQRPLHADSVRADPPGGRGLARRAARPSGGGPWLPLAPVPADAASGALWLDGAAARHRWRHR